jgi:hypothetical protein
LAYDNELVLKAVKTYLAAGIGDALDDVEADWVTAGDPVALPDPVTYFEGYKPTFLEMESAEYPLVAIMADERRPESGGSQKAEWGYQEQVISCTVNFVVVADDEETVNKIAHRYAQALVDLMQAQRGFEGYTQVDYEPAVTLAPASRHPKTHEANLQEAAQTDFIKVGVIETAMEGG